jgi:hypothetical protein
VTPSPSSRLLGKVIPNFSEIPHHLELSANVCIWYSIRNLARLGEQKKQARKIVDEKLGCG